MIIQVQAFLTLLVAGVCAEGVMVPPRASLSPATRLSDTTASRPESHPPTRAWLFPTTNNATGMTGKAHPLIRASPPSTTNDATASTEEPYPPITAPISSSTNDATTSTEEPQPPIHSSFFTTDATTGPNILKLPGNESVSRLLFWPPSAGINVTLNLTTSQLNYSFTVSTALPQHWHSIDIYQPVQTEDHNKASLHLHTEGRYANLEYSRVVKVQVNSDHPTHWCFCPRAHLCTMLSPLRDDDDSSGDQTDLLVALLVVVFLLIVTLLALVGVTFYRKSELFHIYAKPINCLPYAVPPPLPRANTHPSRHDNSSVETKQVEAEKVAANTEQPDMSDPSKVDGDGRDNSAHPSSPAIEPAYDRVYRQQKHESINSLYGLI